MRVGSLFSGIGGLDLGLERAGMEIVWQSEIDPYCCKVLAKHWPTLPNLGDVTKIDWSSVEPVDLICGGFPCQPVSVAGLGRGQADERWLWPEVARCLRVVRPKLVLLENVPGLLTNGFDRVAADLAELGYCFDWDCVSASDVGAPHLRRRVFVVAYAYDAGFQGLWAKYGLRGDPQKAQAAGRGWWTAEPDVGRVAHGIPHRVDRLRALGNAVVPQVAQWIGERIMEAA